MSALIGRKGCSMNDVYYNATLKIDGVQEAGVEGRDSDMVFTEILRYAGLYLNEMDTKMVITITKEKADE